MAAVERANGGQIRKGDAAYAAIEALRKECAENGLDYPRRVVDDLHSLPFGWKGRIPYHLGGEYERLYLTKESLLKPIPLPDEYIIDGDRQIPGENKRQYAKYLAYRDLGRERTVGKAIKALGDGRGGSYGKLAARMRWEERAAAWDAQIEVEARRTAEQAQGDQMRAHLERRENYLNSEHETIVKGMTRIQEMLGMPIVEKRVVTETDREGRATAVTVWEPAKWTYASLSQFIGEIDKIARLHFGLSTSNASQRTEDVFKEKAANKPDLSGPDAAMHQYASEKAEEAYFAAIDEWKARHSGQALPSLVARVAAD